MNIENHTINIVNKMRRHIVYVSALLASLTGFASASQAAEPKPETSPLSALYDCETIEDVTARAFCYDKVVKSLREAEQKKELVAIDKATAETIKKEAFGFKVPSLGKIKLPKLGLGGDEADALTATIQSVSGGGGKYVLNLDNNQVWRTQDVDGVKPRRGMTIIIKSASFGSYMANMADDKRKLKGVRIKRVQ